jgi:uracil-DNA glycosylase
MSASTSLPDASNGNPLCGTDWGRLLEDEFEKSYWGKLTSFVRRERSNRPVYPPANEVFCALQLTWCEQTRVVIVGQDPYYRAGEAHGLCFSVLCSVSRPRSLQSIHRELETDQKIKRPEHGSLVPWAHRGVLLLNRTLTVAHGDAGSHHGKGWENFTNEVIRVAAKESDPVFLLWGKEAHRTEELIIGISGSSDMIIKSSHPAPPACYRPCGGSPAFIGSGPFSKANELLRNSGRSGINWDLTP